MSSGMSTKSDSYSKLIKFLKKYTISKDDKTTKSSVVSFGPPWGKYNMTDKAYDKFISLYSECLGSDKLFFIEQLKKITPLPVDIDFKQNEKKRQYTFEDVENIIWKYHEAIEQFLKVPSKDLVCYLFEKKEPTYDEKKNNYRDGFHLMFPHIPVDVGTKILITDYVLSEVKEENTLSNVPFTNSIDDVFDISVLTSTGWCMYGSRKHTGNVYKLTAKFSFEKNNDETLLLKYDISKIDQQTLPKLLSIRQYFDDTKIPFNDDEFDNDDFEDMKQNILRKYKKGKELPKPKSKPKKEEYTSESDEELSDVDDNDRGIVYKIPDNTLTKEELEARKLVKILSTKRAKSGNYRDWIAVCWTIVNVSTRLKEDWINFSKRGDYDARGCFDAWERTLDKSYPYGIGSLRKWARDDNPDAYDKFIEESIDKMIKEAESGTHYDIAKVLHQMYKDKYICSDINSKIWYEFKNHRWTIVQSAHTLQIKMSEELADKFGMLMTHYFQKGSGEHGATRESFYKQGDKIRKIIENLKNSSFKSKVLAECSYIFFKEQFEELLDSNRMLIGFDNGVFDLDQGVFRDGLPEDYMTLNAGYSFDPNVNKEHIDLIKKFMAQIHPEIDMRQYVLTLLSSYLEGYNREQKFIIWTGSGCHAKGSQIKMYDGTNKLVEDIKIGDKLMGDDSKERNVLELFRGKDKMFKITPIKGDSFIVNQNHVLSLKASNTISHSWSNKESRFKLGWHEYHNGIIVNKGMNFAVRTEKRILYKKSVKYYDTKENALIDIGIKKMELMNSQNVIHKGDVVDIKLCDFMKIRKKIGERNFYLYKVHVNYEKREVEIDPYMLGIWLGDGTSACPQITSADKEIVNYFENHLNVGNTIEYKGNYRYNINGSGKKNGNEFKNGLKKYNLLNNKHIPNDYKFNSRENRLKLLAGLIDSDGSYQKSGKQYAISQKNKKLMEDIVELARSLGYGCYAYKHNAVCTNGKNGKVHVEVMRCHINGNNLADIPVLLSHKKVVEERTKNKDISVTNFNVEYIGEDEYFGFELDKNHRYLTSDFTVHHNSNGKSTLINFFHKAFGEYVGELPPTLITRKSGNASNATPELSDLRGKRFVVFEEPENDDQIYVGNMKRLTGSDYIYARPLYREGFRYLPQFKLLLACNKLPIIPSDDGGTWRRIRVTPFESEFLDPGSKIIDPKRQFYKDKKLADKLEEMKGSFMWYLIHEYYLKIYKIEGLAEPKKVTEHTSSYRKDSDSFKDFLDSTVKFTDKKNDKLSIDSLWLLYKDFHKENFSDKLPSKKDLRNYLTEKKEYEFKGKYLHFVIIDKEDGDDDDDDI